MRFYRDYGRSYRDVRFEDLKEMLNFARFGVNADVQHLGGILRFDSRPLETLKRYLKQNPNDRNAESAKSLWEQALKLCDKAEGLCKQSEELIKRSMREL